MGLPIINNFRASNFTGTTADAYAEMKLDIRGFSKRTVIIKNTHATAGITYKILGRTAPGATLTGTVTSETTLAAGVTIVITSSDVCYGEFGINLKSTTSSTPATYLIEYAISTM